MDERDLEMRRGLGEGWRDWGPEEIREDLARRTNAREIDRRHQWTEPREGYEEGWQEGRTFAPERGAWRRREGGRQRGRREEWWRARPPGAWEPPYPWEDEEPGRGGFGGYGAGPYGGSYGGFGPGEADEYPPTGYAGSTGAGSLSGGFGRTSGWREDRVRMRGQRRGRWPVEGPLVRDLMTREPRFVGPEASVRDAARMMREENAGIIPVCHDGRILGVVTDRDLTIRVLANGKDPTMVRVSEVMSGDVQVVTPEDLLLDAMHIMGEEHVRRVPVVDRDDRLIGILSMSDVAREAEIDYALQEALDRIASRRSFWSRW